MNLFRAIGDGSHLLAIMVLMVKIWRTKSCAGISGKSQVLYALVFTTRYLDLFTNFISPYNTIMKILFLLVSYTTVFMIFVSFKKTYDKKYDTFILDSVLIVFAAGVALLINYRWTVMEVLWTFSIYLESILIIPQLLMIFKMGRTETITTFYLVTLGSYRAWYELNWIWRYHFEGFFDLEAIVAGLVQTTLYCTFFIAAACKKVPLTEKASKSYGKEKEVAVTAISDKLPLVENEEYISIEIK